MANVLKKLARRGRNSLLSAVHIQGADAVAQLQLQLTYQALRDSGKALPAFDQVGFKAYSQTDEDGLLLYIFSLIGVSSKTSVEICAGDGIECNSANLILNHGWHGLLVDGDEALVAKGREFYSRDPRTFIFPPVFVNSWVTRGNINNILSDHGFVGSVDLLCIDMDGVDYWIWDAITCIEPRVVVVEYQDILGPEKSYTVPYEDNFNGYQHPTTDGMPNYCGASLAAFVKLARSKGYRLVGCNRYGFNAFFVKDTLGVEELPEIEISDCFKHAKVKWGMRERYPTVKDLPWVEV